MFLKIKPIAFSLKFLKFTNHYGHWLLISVIIFALLYTLSNLIQWVEWRNYQIYGIKSPILNLDSRDTLDWLMIYMFTGHEANIFPLSALGKILTATTFILRGGAIIVPLVFQYFINTNIKNKMTGQIKNSEDGHIVICGWNESVCLLANSLLKTDHNYQEKDQNTSKIILVNTAYQNIDKHVKDEWQEEFKTNLHEGFIKFYYGDPADIKVLDAIKISKAKRVIIVSNGKGRESDQMVLLTALEISAHCKEIYKEETEAKQTHRKKGAKDHPQPYMVAEVYDSGFIKGLEEAGVNVIISTSELTHNLILQDIVCPGIYNPIRHLIQYEDDGKDNTNDFHTIKVLEHPELIGKTFDQLYSPLRKLKLQLIGFKKIFIDEDGVIIDSHEIKKRLIAKKLESDYIINPQTEHDEKELTEENDEIIVLALDKAHVDKKHLKNLSKFLNKQNN